MKTCVTYCSVTSKNRGNAFDLIFISQYKWNETPYNKIKYFYKEMEAVLKRFFGVLLKIKIAN